MASDKERFVETLLKAPEAEGPASPAAPETGEEPTAVRELPPAEKHKDPVIGTSVSGYLVKGRLGSGGMGIVYEGEQQTIGKRVAIKVLRPEVAENPEVVQRLVAEARAVNQVGHRGIIDVFAFGELPDGRQCIVMEYLDGEALDAILAVYTREKRVMPVGDVLIILDEMLSALSAAHAAGVVHRDLKPSNIFLCRQRDGARYVKLLDFGIAKLGVLGNATPQSRASLMMGTPSYMAPEQAKGGNIGPPMDLYAVGVMAFELFTGRLPFLAGSVVEMLMAHQSEEPPLPSSLQMSLPMGVDEMVGKLLAKRPADRFQTAEEVRELVVKLRREMADPTAMRSKLEVTISARDRAAATARTEARAREAAEIAKAVPTAPSAPARPTPQVTAPMRVMNRTSVVPPHPKIEQTPEQIAQTQEEPSGAMERAPAEPELDALPKSNQGKFIGAAVGVVALLAGGYFFTRDPAPEPEAVREIAIAPAARVEPPPVAAPVAPPEVVAAVEPQPPPVLPPEPPPAPVEPKPEVRVEPAPKPEVKPVAAVAPAPKPEVKPVAAVAPAPKPEVKPVAAVAPALKRPVKGSALEGRLKKLEVRLDKAAAEGGSVELYLKQVKKIQSRLQETGLSDDEKDRLESAVARLEQSTDF